MIDPHKNYDVRNKLLAQIFCFPPAIISPVMILSCFIIKMIKEALPSLWDGYKCEWTGAYAHRYNTTIHATQSKSLLNI